MLKIIFQNNTFALKYIHIFLKKQSICFLMKTTEKKEIKTHTSPTTTPEVTEICNNITESQIILLSVRIHPTQILLYTTLEEARLIHGAGNQISSDLRPGVSRMAVRTWRNLEAKEIFYMFYYNISYI